MNFAPDALLEVRDLCVEFAGETGTVRALDGVSFEVGHGETVGLVGESGCGKTATALALLRLLAPAGRVAGGTIRFQGRDLLQLASEEMRRVRGREIGMVFQDPAAALHPMFPCGEQVAEVLRVHLGCSRRDARARALELLRRVRLSDAERVARAYPHELSGGMCQRVLLAAALACGPVLLVADEPTTALDVTIQAQIFELLHELRAAAGLSLLLITHDLALVAGMADRVVLLYAGKVVESGPVAEVFERPRHPYTQGLLAALPRLEAASGRFATIAGTVPTPDGMPAHCRFEPRCPARFARCREAEPLLRDVGPRHRAACFLEREAEA